MPFDPLVVNVPLILDGNVQVPNVIDPTTEQPVRIIPTTDAWSIKVFWDITGLVAGFLGGDWNVQAFLEALDGGSDPGQVGATQLIALASQPPVTPRNYTTTFNIPANSVRAGIFKLTVAITYTVTFGGVKHAEPMAGFNQGPILQFFVP